jgi:uncharacterized protein YbjT (DUF2867 family)
MSAHILIAGASGAVGARAVVALLSDPRVAVVTAVGRRPLDIEHPKLRVVVVDRLDAAAIAAAVPARVDAAICALGTTRRQAGSKAAFRAVDLDAVVAFAQAAHSRGATRCVLVTAMDADAASWNFYLKTKGEAEDAVAALPFRSVHLLRPSILDDEGARLVRREHRPVEQAVLAMMRAATGVIGATHRRAPIRVDVVGRAAARLALDDDDPGRHVHESDALHRIGASSEPRVGPDSPG